MEPERYRNVMTMTINKNRSKSPGEIADALINAIEIAEALRDEIGCEPARIPAKVIEIARRTDLPGVVQRQPAGGAVLIGEAPPVAGAVMGGGDGEIIPDHWESRAGAGDGLSRLSAWLNENLPRSITLSIPGIDKPVELEKTIQYPGPPMGWVTVMYSMPGQGIGPRMNIMTSKPRHEITVDAIRQDMVLQAGHMYRKDKVTVVARPSSYQPPTQADIERLAVNGDSVSGADAASAREDAAVWAASRPPQWR